MRWVASLVTAIGLSSLTGCGPSSAAAPAAAAEKPKVESDLSRTTLTKQQAQSLSVRSEPVTIEKVQQHVKLAGWVMPQQGNEVTLTTPVAGYVRRPEKTTDFPIPGKNVSANQVVLLIEPVLSPLDQFQLLSTQVQLSTLKRSLESELAKATDSVTAAESEFKRTQELQKQGLRGQQDLEQATVRVKHAGSDLEAATDKLKLFTKSVQAGTESLVKPLPILAQRSGSVLSVIVNPGQFVPAAAPLVTIADLDQPWIRVPLPEQYLPLLDRKGPATITVGDGSTSSVRIQTESCRVVPLVDTLRHTADVIYTLAPATNEPKTAALPAWAKDQMVAVEVPLGIMEKQTLVPADGVIFDAFGTACVYVELKEGPDGVRHFKRLRVEPGPRLGKNQVIRPGLNEKDRVVVNGAAAIFSREFHKPPAGAPPAKTADDDD